MKLRTLLVSALAATALTLTAALPAQAASYQDPFTTNGKITYNNHAYYLAISPASSSQVERYGHNVNTTYKVYVTDSNKKTIYSDTLGYARIGYLNTKLTTATVTRDYSLTTYIKKVTAFSAAYATARNNALVTTYREKRLRADVQTTARNVITYRAAHNEDISGIGSDPNVIAKSGGYYAYNEGDNLEIHISFDPNYGKKDANGNTNRVYYVTGIEKADLYQSVYDGNSGAFRSGPIDNVDNID